MTEQEQLEQAIAAQVALRGTLPDAVVDATIAALREKLASLQQAPPDEQRKLVTVLFADLVGWTAMSEQLDAEDVREIQQAYFAAVTPPILQRGGRIEKYIGDAILAVFGVPRADETDPENAVRAALAMQQAMIALNHRLAESSFPTSPLRSVAGVPDPLILSVRIGVHTGPVLATVGQRSDDFVVTGDTVNLAARLQAAAPPGAVLISHSTWRYVADLFDAVPQEPLILKGKAEPVRGHLVLRARPRPFRRSLRGVAGVKTRMIGRKTELGLLQDTLTTIMEDRQAQMVTVVGEAGVGKSRLMVEFEAWADLLPHDVTYFKGRATPETQQTPYGLLRDLFATRFQIEESDTLPDVRRKLKEGLTSPSPTGKGSVTGLDTKETHLIGQLLGYDFGDSPHVKPLLDDPQQLRAQALAALETYFRALVEHDPLAVFLEDVHWADDSSLDVVNHLLSKLEQTPLLVLCAGRSSLYQRRPHWGEGLTYHRRLDLQPLSKRAVGQLLEEILQRAGEVPTKLRDLVVDGADGNPFFVEELVNMLLEDGVIVADADGRSQWRIETERLATVQVPPSLTSLLQARVDRLPLEGRNTLQQASVVGRLFWDGAVAHMQRSSGEGGGDLSGTLSSLQAREMVFQHEAIALGNSQEYLFKHALLRDVVYESVLKRLRRVYHGLVADWLIEQVGERIGEFVGIIADHLEGAGRSDEAVGYLMRAGDQARIVHAHVEAVQRYQHALALLETKGDYDQAARVCMRLGITHQNAYDSARAREAFDKGFALWQRAGEVLEAVPLPPAPHALRLGWSEPKGLDPTLFEELNSAAVIGHLFSGLVEPGYDFEIAPDIARSWQISEDGRTYVFHLRDDVRWSDGTPVTAGDFAYAWKRRLDPARPAESAALLYDIRNARAYHQGELVDAGRLGVRAVDDSTLVVELVEPAGYFLQLVAQPFTYPVARHVVQTHGESWTEARNIVTNGPFLLKAWKRGRSMVLVRNPSYHGRFKGNVVQVDYANFDLDRSVWLAMYEADELDVVPIQNADWMRVKQLHLGEYATSPVRQCQYLGINVSKQPFDDPRVRRALAMATDREAFAGILFQGHNIPATGGFVPPDLPGHSPGIGLPYDPVQARRLLAEAGYPDGHSFPVVEAHGMKGHVRPIDFLRQQWLDNLGIEVKWVILDRLAFLDLNKSLMHMFMTGWMADYPDPDSFLRVGLQDIRSTWQNATYEKLVTQAGQVTDQQERMQLYRQADQILIQEAAVIPLAYVREHRLRKPWLTVPYRNRDVHTKDIIIWPH